MGTSSLGGDGEDRWRAAKMVSARSVPIANLQTGERESSGPDLGGEREG